MNKMRLQVIEDAPPTIEQMYDFLWDFSKPGYKFIDWFLWFANDAPTEVRIVCNSEELRDSMKTFFFNHWGELTADGTEVLFQEGDFITGMNAPSYRTRVFISSSIEEL